MARTKMPKKGCAGRAHMWVCTGIHKQSNPHVSEKLYVDEAMRHAEAAARAGSASMNTACAKAARLAPVDVAVCGEPNKFEMAAAKAAFDSFVPSLRTAMALTAARFAPDPNPLVEEPTRPPSPGHSPTTPTYLSTSPWRGD